MSIKLLGKYQLCFTKILPLFCHQKIIMLLKEFIVFLSVSHLAAGIY